MLSRKQIIIGVITFVFALLFYSYLTTSEIFYSPATKIELEGSGAFLAYCDDNGRCTPVISAIDLAEGMESVTQNSNYPGDNPLQWFANCFRNYDSQMAFCDDSLRLFPRHFNYDFCASGAKESLNRCVRFFM